MITKATSSLDSSSISSLTNEGQAVVLTNSVSGITKQFSTMKAAYQFFFLVTPHLQASFAFDYPLRGAKAKAKGSSFGGIEERISPRRLSNYLNNESSFTNVKLAPLKDILT